jgi:exosortase D (VPLPA-CTERM-specific)
VAGAAALAFGLLVYLVGQLGADVFVTRVSFVLVLTGLLWFLTGARALRAMAAPLVFLLIAIPLPALVVNAVTLPLQLLASRLGEATLSAAGVAVFRDGNLIELPSTTLEVAEACSGLRSIVSLAGIGGLLAWTERGWLRRALLVAATLPIAIVMNGLRIAATGLACESWGPRAASGPWHSFSGWVTFLVSVLALLGLQRVAARPRPRGMGTPRGQRMNWHRALAALLMIAATGALAHAARVQGPAARAQLESLPYQVAGWKGRDATAPDAETLRILAADTYLNRSYANGSGTPIDLYIAYYGRQQPGVSIHSPLHCLPGTGWEPLDIATLTIAQPGGAEGQLRRLIVRKNMASAVVLYWYAIHGRMIANETLSKAWLLHDSLRFHRSDAALVRIVVPVRGAAMDAAEHDALAFAGDVLPYLPHLWN